MGCGGSKEDVAAGNTVTTAARRLLQKKSDVAKSESLTTTSSSSNSNQETGVEPTSNAAPLLSSSNQEVGVEPTSNAAPLPSSSNQEAGVEPTSNDTKPVPDHIDIVKPEESSAPKVTEVESAGEKVEEKGGEEKQLISEDFEEEAAKAIARRLGSEGAEYYSPPPEPEKNDSEINGSEGSNETSKLVAAVAAAVDAGEGEAVKTEELQPVPREDGETNSKDLADLPSLVEEKESEVTIKVQEKNVEGEKGDIDSLPQ